MKLVPSLAYSGYVPANREVGVLVNCSPASLYSGLPGRALDWNSQTKTTETHPFPPVSLKTLKSRSSGSSFMLGRASSKFTGLSPIGTLIKYWQETVGVCLEVSFDHRTLQ